MHKKVRLVSKRNEVYRVYDGDRTFIEKIYSSEEAADWEEELLIYLQSKGVAVPGILHKEGRRMELQDAGRETFLDLFERAESTGVKYENTALGLEKWLLSYYSAMKDYRGGQLIRSDVNFRNFVVNLGGACGCYSVTGIDFESSVHGRVETDIGRMAAYALTYEPVMTDWKIEFARVFVHRMCSLMLLDENEAIKELKKEIREIELRRGKVLNLPL